MINKLYNNSLYFIQICMIFVIYLQLQFVITFKNHHLRQSNINEDTNIKYNQFINQQNQLIQQQDPNWDYKNTTIGEWIKPYCSNDPKTQSPANIIDKSILSTCYKQYSLEFIQNDNNITTYLNNTRLNLNLKGNWDSIKLNLNNNELIYDAQEIQFHSPSEHTINGVHHQLEMQISHFIRLGYEDSEHQDNNLILSIFFDISSDPNPFFYQSQQQPYEIDIQKSCLSEECTEKDKININFSKFNLNITDVYYYQGSYTIPPCIPNVKWFIVNNIQTMSEKQMLMFKDYWNLNSKFADNYLNPDPSQWKGNNRPIMQTIQPIKFQVNNTNCKDDK